MVLRERLCRRNVKLQLKAMGFPEQLVIEAYFACDKNEDLAVNYILARMDEVAVSYFVYYDFEFGFFFCLFLRWN